MRFYSSDPLIVDVAFPRFMVAMKLFAAGAKIDADDIVLLCRQLGLTTVDEGLDLAEQAYLGRPVPARFDSCLRRLGSPTELAVSYRQNSGGDLIFSMAPGSGTGSDRGPAFPGVLVGLLRCCGLAWGVADLPGWVYRGGERSLCQ